MSKKRVAWLMTVAFMTGACLTTLLDCAGSKPVTPTGPTAPGVDVANVLAVVIAAAEASIPVLEATGGVDTATGAELQAYISSAGQATQVAIAELKSSDSKAVKTAKIVTAFLPVVSGPKSPLTAYPRAQAVVRTIQAAASALFATLQQSPDLVPAQSLTALNVRAVAVQARVTHMRK